MLFRSVNEKASLTIAVSEAFQERVKGIEPSSKAWEAEGTASQTLQIKAFLPSAESVSAPVSPKSGKTRRESRSQQDGESKAETPAPMPATTETTTDFASALAMLSALPLTDAERLEAVRRLLADQPRTV